MARIRVEDLIKEYNSPGGSIVAVRGVDFTINDGEFFTIVGPSGCGKTTTLRCIAGLVTPTSGSIYFDNQEITHVPPNKRGIAMMFQNIALYPHMSVEDNISYPLRLANVSKDVQRKETESAARVMQIEELLKKYPGQLSGGQKQRAALARTLVQDPHAFLMDEPLSDLDAKLKVEMRKEIQKVHEQVDRPTIYVTHDQEEAMTMSDRIAVMNDGNIVQIGTPDELYNEPRTLFVAQFIGNPSINTLEANLVSAEDGRLTVAYNGFKREFLVDSDEVPDGDTVTLGVRPEHAKIDEGSADIVREIQIIERIGDRILITTAGDPEFRILVPPGSDISEGEEVSLSFDPEDVFLFAESGELIGKGKEMNPVQSV